MRLDRIRSLLETQLVGLQALIDAVSKIPKQSQHTLAALRDARAETEDFICEANLFLAALAPQVKLRFAEQLDKVLRARDAIWQLIKGSSSLPEEGSLSPSRGSYRSEPRKQSAGSEEIPVPPPMSRSPPPGK